MTMEDITKLEPVAEGSPFERARAAMATVLGEYKNMENSGKKGGDIDLYEFPEMMKVVTEAERENMERAIAGEEPVLIEETPEFTALAQSTEGSRPIKLAHIYEMRLHVLEQLERERTDPAELATIARLKTKYVENTKPTKVAGK